MPFNKKSLDKAQLELRTIFSNCIQEGSGYIPSLWLYKNNQKVITIICRNTDGSFQDKELSFIEMFTTIASVDPDEVIFCADAYFDSVTTTDNSLANKKDIFEDIQRSGVSAMFVTIESKYGIGRRVINPYFKSNDNRMWWIDSPDLQIGRQAIPNNNLDAGHDNTSSHIRKVMGMIGCLPFSTATHFDMLTSLGHDLRVASNYKVRG